VQEQLDRKLAVRRTDARAAAAVAVAGLRAASFERRARSKSPGRQGGSEAGFSGSELSSLSGYASAAMVRAGMPEYHGEPGPGSYDAYLPLGQSRSAPVSPTTSYEERNGRPPNPRGISKLQHTLAGEMSVHGTLPDSQDLMWRRHLARRAGVQYIRADGRARSRSPGARTEIGELAIAATAAASAGRFDRRASHQAAGPRHQQMALWLERACGILPVDSKEYASILVGLGCDSPGDVADLTLSDLPKEVRLLHGRRMIEVAKLGATSVHGY
jgi:hypothetical protein